MTFNFIMQSYSAESTGLIPAYLSELDGQVVKLGKHYFKLESDGNYLVGSRQYFEYKATLLQKQDITPPISDNQKDGTMDPIELGQLANAITLINTYIINQIKESIKHG